MLLHFLFLAGGCWYLSFPFLFLFLLWTGWLSELDAGGCKETDKVGWVGGLVAAVGELVVNFFCSMGRGSLSVMWLLARKVWYSCVTVEGFAELPGKFQFVPLYFELLHSLVRV